MDDYSIMVHRKYDLRRHFMLATVMGPNWGMMFKKNTSNFYIKSKIRPFYGISGYLVPPIKNSTENFNQCLAE